MNLKEKASELSSDFSADVFNLLDADGCLLCCDDKMGGNTDEQLG